MRKEIAEKLMERDIEKMFGGSGSMNHVRFCVEINGDEYKCETEGAEEFAIMQWLMKSSIEEGKAVGATSKEIVEIMISRAVAMAETAGNSLRRELGVRA